MCSPLSHCVRDWDAQRELLQNRRYGVIVASAGALEAVHLRLFPKLLAWPEIWPVGPTYHAAGRPDRCLLYYNQPRRHPSFLALKYMVTTPGSSYTTLTAALKALDRLAALKRTDALLCDVRNRRISNRALERLGWTPHKKQFGHRNFIKRFYGTYPDQ